MENEVKATIFLLSVVILLTACGQKGPLYLPQPEPEQRESR